MAMLGRRRRSGLIAMLPAIMALGGRAVVIRAFAIWNATGLGLRRLPLAASAIRADAIGSSA